MIPLHNTTDTGAKVRRRNLYISIIFGIVFFALLIWLLKTGQLNDTDKIQAIIARAGIFSPLLFILMGIFTSYVPVIPMGSLGSIGIVLFGPVCAFVLNSITSILNCLLGYLLARKFGTKIILWFAAPETVDKYIGWLKKSGRYDLFFAIIMFMPVSPDIVLCMIAGLTGMKITRFLPIILVSRPFSSWCYSTGLLKIFQWLRTLFHL